MVSMQLRAWCVMQSNTTSTSHSHYGWLLSSVVLDSMVLVSVLGTETSPGLLANTTRPLVSCTRRVQRASSHSTHGTESRPSHSHHVSYESPGHVTPHDGRRLHGIRSALGSHELLSSHSHHQPHDSHPCYWVRCPVLISMKHGAPVYWTTSLVIPRRDLREVHVLAVQEVCWIYTSSCICTTYIRIEDVLLDLSVSRHSPSL